MNAILLGPLALAIRYALVLLAGALANMGLGLWDAATGTLTIQVEDAANVVASLALLLGAVAWRKAAVMLGGKT